MKKQNHIRPSELLQKLKKEIIRFTNENKSGKSRFNYFKNKMKELGMKDKKSFIPFKHRLLLKEHKTKKQQREIEEYGSVISKKFKK